MPTSPYWFLVSSPALALWVARPPEDAVRQKTSGREPFVHHLLRRTHSLRSNEFPLVLEFMR